MTKEKAIRLETDEEYEIRSLRECKERAEIYRQAEQIYFAVVEHLNLTEVMIEEDSGGATRNTEKGRDLYYLIEDNLRGEDK